MKSAYLMIDDLKINYTISGIGKPMVFFHGGGTEAKTYTPIIQFLSKNNKVIAPDIPFFGSSDCPKRIFSFDDYSKLFEKFILNLDLTDVVLVGYSFGGGIAARLSENKRVKKVILCSPALQNLSISKLGLVNIVFREFFASFKYIKNKKQLNLFLNVVNDFIKNLLKCKQKKLLTLSMIKCLNTSYDFKFAKKRFIILSHDDPIFIKKKYLLQKNNRCFYSHGSHLWFILNHEKFENIYNEKCN